jgi:diguanylate cyclase (GGDEF)-like protein/PAS domain S-box-containing protein
MIKFYCTIFFIFLFFTTSLYSEPLISEKQKIVIGVMAFRSKPDTLRDWEPLAQYLHQQIPSYDFEIRPFTYEEFNSAAASKELDFAVTNPEHYVYFSVKYDATRIATLIRANVGGKELKKLGGVIIARSDRKDIVNLEDLKGKHIAAVEKLSLGGYLAQSTELLLKGIDVRSDLQVTFTDMPHDKVVHAVENGLVDAGFIRTGVLENMAKEGKINRSDFKIIHPVNIKNFPQALSTTLYPEWPFVAFKEVDPELANKVAIALLSLPRGSVIAKNAGYYGWSIPLSYEEIRILMVNLRVPPYDDIPSFTVSDIIQKYVVYIMLILGFIIALLVFLALRMRELALTLKKKSQYLEHEITIREETEKDLRRIANVFHNSREGIVMTDPNKVIIDVNEAFCFLTGYSREEVIGKTPKILRSERHESDFYIQINQALEQDGSWRGEIWNKKKNNQEYAEFLRIDSIRNPEGEIENYIGIFSDITEHKKQQEQLQHMANYDPLTNLPNRNLFMTLAEQILSFSARKKSKAVVSFLDLDGFKNINDMYGHDVGDNVLRQVSHRLEKELRQSDAIARIGGDEFVIIFCDINSVDDVQPLFERILHTLKEPFLVNENQMSIGVSIGAAFYPDHGEEIEILVRHADAAMYRSKENGRNQVTYFDQEKMG